MRIDRFYFQIISQGLISLINLLKNKLIILYLGVEQYSFYALLSVNSSPVISFFGNTADLLIMRKLQKSRRITKYVISELILLFALSIFQTLVFIIIAFSFNLDNKTHFYATFIIFSIFQYFNIVSVAKLKGFGRFLDLNKALLFSALFVLILQFPLLFIYKESSLYFVLILNSFLPSIISTYIASKKYDLIVNFNDFRKYQLKFLKVYLLKGLNKSISTLVILGTQAVVFNFVFNFLGEKFSSYYFALNSLAIQISNIILSSIANQYFQKQLDAYKKGLDYFKILIIRQSIVVINIMFITCLLTIFFSKMIIMVALTDEFLSHIEIFKYLVIATFINSSKQVYDISLQCHRVKTYYLNTSMICSLSLVIFAFLSLSIFGNLFALSVAFIVNSVFVNFVIFYYYFQTYKNYPDKKPIFLIVFYTSILLLLL